MKHIRNEKGIALVMVLILSLIGLAIVSSLLFMATEGTRMSGSQRFYRTAEEAGVGGSEVLQEFIIYRGVLPTTLVGGLQNMNAVAMSSAGCLTQKFSTARLGTWPPTSSWTACAANDLLTDTKSNPDLQFDVTNPQKTFRIYTKIVDTVLGNSATGGLVSGGGSLGGFGVINASGEVTPLHVPYLYRVEVQAEDRDNPKEKANFTGLYAY